MLWINAVERSWRQIYVYISCKHGFWCLQLEHHCQKRSNISVVTGGYNIVAKPSLVLDRF